MYKTFAVLLLSFTSLGCRSINKSAVRNDQSAQITERDKLWLRAIIIADEYSELYENELHTNPEELAKLPEKVDKKFNERLKYVENLKKYTPEQIQAILERGVIVNKKKEPIIFDPEGEGDDAFGKYERLLDPQTGEIAFRVRVKHFFRGDRIKEINEPRAWFDVKDSVTIRVYDWRAFDDDEEGDVSTPLHQKVFGMRMLAEHLGLNDKVAFPQSAWVSVQVKGQSEPAKAFVWVRNEEGLKELHFGGLFGHAAEDGLQGIEQVSNDENLPSELRSVLKEFAADLGARFVHGSETVFLKDGPQEATLMFLDLISGNGDRHDANYRLLPDGKLMGWDEDWALLETPEKMFNRNPLENRSPETQATVAQMIKSASYRAVAEAAKKTNLSYSATLWTMTRLSQLKQHPEWMWLDDPSNIRGFKEADLPTHFYSDLTRMKEFVELAGLNFDKEYLSGDRAKAVFKKLFPSESVTANLREKDEDEGEDKFKISIDRNKMKISSKFVQAAPDSEFEPKDIDRMKFADFRVKYIEARDSSNTFTLISEEGEWIYVRTDKNSIEFCSKDRGGCPEDFSLVMAESQ
jgi:hypothetical protein